MKYVKTLILIFLLIPLHAEADLTLTPVNESHIRGTFDIIIYSNSFINDPETFVILDKSDDSINIKPYAPDFKFRVIKNLSETEALRLIREILNSPSNISSINFKEIKDSDKIFGFEIKPQFFPWIFGIIEPVETSYRKRGNQIDVFIRLNPRVERQLNSGDNTDRDN